MEKCREMVLTDKGLRVCNTELRSLEVEKPFDPFSAEKNHGVEESRVWTVIYCPYCHFAHITG